MDASVNESEIRLGPFDPACRFAMDFEFFLRDRRAGPVSCCAPEIPSRMPDHGVSSCLDGPSLHTQFDEERRVQIKYCLGPGMRTVFGLYVPFYLGYQRLRSALAGVL